MCKVWPASDIPRRWHAQPVPLPDRAGKLCEDWFALTHAYYKAAVHGLRPGGTGRRLEEAKLLPAIFLCRHFLELALKTIWLESELLKAAASKTVALACLVKKCKECFRHNLAKLWAACKGHLDEQAKGKGFDADELKRHIDDFIQLDPSSYEFRYPGDSLAGRKINLPRLRANFAGIGQCLLACAGQATLIRQLFHSFITVGDVRRARRRTK